MDKTMKDFDPLTKRQKDILSHWEKFEKCIIRVIKNMTPESITTVTSSDFYHTTIRETYKFEYPHYWSHGNVVIKATRVRMTDTWNTNIDRMEYKVWVKDTDNKMELLLDQEGYDKFLVYDMSKLNDIIFRFYLNNCGAVDVAVKA